MKFLKIFMLSLVLLVGNACSFGTIINNNELNEFKPASQKTTLFESKTLPEKYILSPLPDLDIQAGAAILINAVTGEILFEKNINESRPIASMSKIMTELLILEAIELGSLNWDDVIPISDYAYLISNYPGYASVQLRQDKDYTAKELFNAMAIRSANGATIALAEAVGMNEKHFVTQMNEKAKQLELHDTNFVNSTGLTNIDLLKYHSVGTTADSNMMSARDLAILAKHILNNFPELIEVTQRTELNFQDKTYANSNAMLPGLLIDWLNEDLTFQGVDGLKTGFTGDAGYGFTGTVKINERRFISVIIDTEEYEDRFVETKTLYNAILEQLEE